ncbi:WD40 repeat protein [Plasmopara halstedii]|uniref:WD40 repeat protein n=1 Tax=Plasmopara halstedii TaxID=4781 RepID=A0A0P1B883_PLAHL|nr:WD40 repeat protein [Plasmopara halstedii]CEG50454.1 WD40 repeat protein [Plasmopara halstedii]|eukprot:XP_024586823.1 WD40 repeat protein [Plasmopara halstedii]
MYFCTGPPRTYATSATHERLEDVAISMHPSQLVFARVTASEVALWSASPGIGRRLLASCHRSGQYMEKEVKKEIKMDQDLYESELHQLWTVWVSGHRLAVVEKGSQFIEFYAFDGLIELIKRSKTLNCQLPEDNTINNLVLDQPSFPEPEHEEKDDVTSFVTKLKLVARFIHEFSLNQEDQEKNDKDVATSMSGISGSKYVFVGMASGFISVVEVSESFDLQDDSSSWFSTLENATKLWKIDVRTHLAIADETQPTSCFDLTCATSDPLAQIMSLHIIATFTSGKCFIIVISPIEKKIQQLLSLVNTEKEDMRSSKCCTTKLDASGYRLAIGWSDGGVSLFQLSTEEQDTSLQLSQVTLSLSPIRELNLKPWGYHSNDIGAVTALAWSNDGQSLAVGYALRGFSLFSIDGCRLMSTLSQHQQERRQETKLVNPEICAFGVLSLEWTHENFSLLVVPRGEETTQVIVLPEKKNEKISRRQVTEVMDTIQVKLEKTQDGLCLSLSGAVGRCGAWVRSDKSFTKRTKDGTIGPAEACGLIHGGDLLVGINDNYVITLPFEKIVHELKELPNFEQVTLTFLRLKWDVIFPLALNALSSIEFQHLHGIHLLDDENLCIREYALRMQALHGDCDVNLRPSLMEFEQRAKFDGWETMRGTSTQVAQHKYVKFLFALFPVWNLTHFLNVLLAFGESSNETNENDKHDREKILKSRNVPSISFAEYDFAKILPLSTQTSRLMLLERQSIRLVAAPTLDDPCAITSCVHWSVPQAFEKCCPLRFAAMSASGKHVAVAGQRGFCLLNVVTGKWRMFGNVNDEHDMVVYALLWLTEDVIVVHFTRWSEEHQIVHFQVYPRDHLDANALLNHLEYPRPKSVNSKEPDCFLMMESDTTSRNIYCISQYQIWWFQVQYSGTLQQQNVQVTMNLKRQVPLPSRILNHFKLSRYAPLSDIAILPRYSHLQEESIDLHKDMDENEDVSWLATVVNQLVHGQVPDQYTPEQVLPRFAFLDKEGNVIVWDPETRSQRLVCSNISTMTRVFVSPLTCASWPSPCRLVYGLYGPDGMKLWLPLLDGVYCTRNKAFDHDERRLETFLACHDPLRAKTYEIEFGTAPATAELYEQVLREYGIVLDHFLTTRRMDVDDERQNLRGCVMTVDEWSTKDQMLRFDIDVQLLGADSTFGLLVGVSQDVYFPSGVFLPCYDVFARVQPIFHTLLCFLVQNEQLSWAQLVLNGIRHHFALSTATQELFLHSILESCYVEQCSLDKVKTAITLLREGNESRDIVEYCEIIAHVARKSEPSRLQILFPAAGDPMELLRLCQQRSELRTAANFLLILEECSTVSGSSLPLRMESAAELLKQCIDQEEWRLAQHVVRVAREWNHPQLIGTETCGNTIDEQLASLVYDNLVRGEYERVVWCIEDLQAKLPLKTREERENDVKAFIGDSSVMVARLVQAFIQENKRRQLRILLQAVTEAHYDEWIARLRHVMEQ